MAVHPGRTRRTRVVAGACAVTLLASGVGASADTRFTDVPDDSVHADAIADLAEREVVIGRTPTTFAPRGTVTRAQLATMVARAADLPPASTDPFEDTAGSPHAPTIAAAHEAGLVLGYEDGTFGPNEPIRRGQIAAVLARWLQPPAVDDDAFSDLDRSIHRDAINALAGIEVARGSTDGTFRPASALRRDQAASFLWRAIEWQEERADRTVDLTVLGTADLHNHVFDWDYYLDRPFSDLNVGLARVGTLVEQIRDERGEDRVLLVDSGDTFQGNPFASYYANQRRITDQDEYPHPMALTMNALGYDAMTVGNHEYNYGVDFLDAFVEQVDFPVLGANALDADTGEPHLEPYTIVTVEVDGADPIEVGILGLTNPGSAVWDRSNVEGVVDFGGGVEAAEEYVPVIREAGADVVIVNAHAGISGANSTGVPFPENFVQELAETVPGIDAIVSAHSHVEVPEERFVNEVSGEEVVVTQPGAWGRFLSVIDLELVADDDGWSVQSVGADTWSTAEVPESETITGAVTEPHAATVEYVNSPIAEATEDMPLANATTEDVAALDLINHVQTVVTEEYVPGTEWEDLEVLSLAAPFVLDNGLPEGQVSVRDVAGLYIYDNTLVVIELTGAEIEDLLEWSAEFFEGEDEVPTSRDDISTTKPSYNFDVLSGVTYEIDLAQPVGERIIDLELDGEPIDPEQRFVVATNNYRANGGGSAPHVADAPTVWDSRIESREMIIEWAEETGLIDPADFHTVDWRLIFDGEPIEFPD